MDILVTGQPRWMSAEKRSVLVKVQVGNEWLDYHACPWDQNPPGVEIFNDAIAGRFGSIAPPDGYVEQNGELVMLPEFAAAQFEQAKQEAKQAVLNFAEQARQQLAGNPTPTALEAAAWSAKEARARRVVDGSATELDQQIVQIECNERGLNETVAQLAALQLSKSAQLLMAVSIIDGMTKAALTAVNAAATTENLNLLIAQLKTAGEQRLQQLMGP